MKAPTELLVAAALWAGLAGCGSKGTAAEGLDGASQGSIAVNGRDFTLRPGQSVRLAGTRSTFRFLAVPEDSRCHPTVVCIWAGNARLSLQLDETPFFINSTLEPREAVVQGFRFSLVQLTRRPLGDTVASNYSATFRVTR